MILVAWGEQAKEERGASDSFTCNLPIHTADLGTGAVERGRDGKSEQIAE